MGNAKSIHVFQYLSIPLKKHASNPSSRLSHDTGIDKIFNTGDLNIMSLLAPTTFAKKSNPLSVPIATVRLRIISKATRAIPANTPPMRNRVQTAGQTLVHWTHLELPIDRLRSAWQAPQSTPERPLAH